MYDDRNDSGRYYDSMQTEQEITDEQFRQWESEEKNDTGFVLVRGTSPDRYTTCSYQHNLAISCNECTGRRLVDENGNVITER